MTHKSIRDALNPDRLVCVVKCTRPTCGCYPFNGVSDDTTSAIAALLADRDQLAAEVEALRVDAERYRWLREGVWPDASYSDGCCWGFEVPTDTDYVKYMFHGAQMPSFDEAVDAEMKKERANAG